MIQTKMTLNVALENRLAGFIASLATAPQKLREYLDEPESAMAEAGLNEQEKEVLRSGSWQVICDFLGPDDTRPLLVVDDPG